MQSRISKVHGKASDRINTAVVHKPGPGTLVEITNDTDGHVDVNYASVTAPDIVCVEVFIDDRPQDCVYVGAGGSHSWWAQAGGKLLPHNGLAPGETLKITTTGRCALRIDWA